MKYFVIVVDTFWQKNQSPDGGFYYKESTAGEIDVDLSECSDTKAKIDRVMKSAKKVGRTRGCDVTCVVPISVMFPDDANSA